MQARLPRFLLSLLHGLLRVTGVAAILLFILLALAAYGIPGRWAEPYLNAALRDTSLSLHLSRVSYLPLRGLQLSRVRLVNADGKVLLSFSKGSFGFTLFSAEPWEKRLTHIALTDLFVAQIEYPPASEAEPVDLDAEAALRARREPFPDFSHILLPSIGPVDLRLRGADVLDVKVDDLTGTVTTSGGLIRFSNLHAKVDRDDQVCDADIDVDLHAAVVKAHIRGFIFQTRLNGIWDALDFPVVKKYSNHFTLERPAWGDCSFTVGFDKYRNIFHLNIDIAAKKGAYCGVPFDEASATIRCDGIWDTVTTISPLIARRNGEVAARGELVFDTVTDKFIFRAESTRLQPAEAFALVNMPFTEAIPEIVGTLPPHLTLSGEIPLRSDQTPERVSLTATVDLPAGGTLHGIPVRSARADIVMRDGLLTLSDFSAAFPDNGLLRGDILFHIPNDAAYTDLSALLYLEKISLATLLQPFDAAAPGDASVTGLADISCRTDATLPSTLDAAFSLTLDGGLITRIPLFAGLTDLIADNIPGISSLTDSSTAKLIGTADSGFFSIPGFTLTGDLLSIEGPITYSLPNDLLFAQITAGNFKQGSLLGTLTRWLTVPLNKLIWQIKVSGPLASPDWEIITIIEGLWHRAWGKDPFTAPPSPESND